MTPEPTCNVLVVDDEPLIAMLIEDMLTDLGCRVVGPAYGLSDAMKLASESEIDWAVLDVHLDGANTTPVAQVLRERKIPFAFVSGWAGKELEGPYGDAPVLQKPFVTRDIQALKSLFSAGSDA
jgi:CheY-like chemotaxis protein